MKILLLILLSVVVVAAIYFYWFHKINLVKKGHRLNWSDGDSVSVSEEDLQDFMFDIEASLNSETMKPETVNSKTMKSESTKSRRMKTDAINSAAIKNINGVKVGGYHAIS